MKILPAVLLLSLPAFAADFKESDCPLTGAQVEKATKLKLKKPVVVTRATGDMVACEYPLETSSVHLTRVAPSLRNAKTEAELAAKLAEDEKPRTVKDFPVPAYRMSGGLYVVLPNETWQVLTYAGAPRGNADPYAVAKALVEARKK